MYEPLEPGKEYDIGFSLRDTAYRFVKGHRIRVSFSTSYWPTLWPSPEMVMLWY